MWENYLYLYDFSIFMIENELIWFYIIKMNPDEKEDKIVELKENNIEENE